MASIDFSELKRLEPRWLGLADYETALATQLQFVESVRGGDDAIALACEHPTVITLGKRGQPLEDIMAGFEVLRNKNIKIVATDRGGQATLHNPGQLVLYPILPLRRWGLGVRDYVECLERATASYLAGYGIEVTRGFEPGLFAREMKLAAFGIRVNQGISLHGVAINLRNDLSEFNYIRQCGQSLAATNVKAELEAMNFKAPPWELAVEAAHWTDLFKLEVQAIFEAKTGPKPESGTPDGRAVHSDAKEKSLRALELEASALDFRASQEDPLPNV